MSHTLKMLDGSKENPVTLSSIVDGVDTIDLTGSVEFVRKRRLSWEMLGQPDSFRPASKKQRVHTQYDGLLTSTSKSNAAANQARMIPTATLVNHHSSRTSTAADAFANDATEDNEFNLRHTLSDRELRNYQKALALNNGLPQGHKVLRSAAGPCGLVIKPEMGVQLFPNETGEVHYFSIKQIIEDESKVVYVRGLLLKRHYSVYFKISERTGKHLHAILPLHINELCMHLTSAQGAISPLRNECLTVVPLRDIESERNILFTNHEFPTFNYQSQGMSVQVDGKKKVEEQGVLCCRWKYVEEVRGKNGVPAIVSPLDPEECDVDKAIPNVVKRSGYGGAMSHSRSSHNHSRIRASTVAKPTFGDICVGCGGTFRAAEMAGMNLIWCLDKWDIAINTIRENWPHLRERALNCEIQDFLTTVEFDESWRVDVIHISFPCQPHSRINQNSNEKQDLMNAATITTLEGILKHLKPRIVTLEQTDGILSKDDGFWFRKVVYQITAAGYGARCKVFNMAHYGVPSARRRLIIVAACPGETLPEWPKPTHGPGLKPLVTAGQAIEGLHPDDPYHNVAEKKREYLAKQSISPSIGDMNVPLKRIILTGGVDFLMQDADGGIYRPTVAQMKRWMTFPDHHILCASDKKNFRIPYGVEVSELTGLKKDDFTTQLGNAVPPLFMKQIFKKVQRVLEKSNEEAMRWKNEVLVVE